MYITTHNCEVTFDGSHARGIIRRLCEMIYCILKIKLVFSNKRSLGVDYNDLKPNPSNFNESASVEF